MGQNLSVEAVIPSSIMRQLSDGEIDEYRRPTLSWPRQVPIDGKPDEVAQVVSSYAAYLASSPVQKPSVNAQPGALIGDPERAEVRTWPHVTEATVEGRHFIQEDGPHKIGRHSPTGSPRSDEASAPGHVLVGASRPPVAVRRRRLGRDRVPLRGVESHRGRVGPVGTPRRGVPPDLP